MRHLILALIAMALSYLANAQNPSPAPEERYAALMNEYNEALKQATDGLRAAKTKVERQKVVAAYPTVDRFGPRFLELAKKYPHTSAACDALIWIVNESRRGSDTFPPSRIELTSEAMERLVGDHVNDTRLGQLCRGLVHYPSRLRDKFLHAVHEKTTNREVRARACLSLAEYLVRKLTAAESARSVDLSKRKPSFDAASDAYFLVLHAIDPTLLTQEAERLFENVINDYGDLTERRGAVTLAQVAEADLKALRQLGVGKAAPEIDGTDVNGNHLKLSDFRGKVVVIVFSGDWCAPCRQQYPHERRLVSRLAGKPFALLSVNTDAEKETVQKLISAGTITWKCWWDGGLAGPVCKAWNVHGFPSVFIIDSNGVIRHSGLHLRGEKLDEAVDGLLKELESSPRP